MILFAALALTRITLPLGQLGCPEEGAACTISEKGFQSRRPQLIKTSLHQNFITAIGWRQHGGRHA